jgi:hypothetical protein
MRALNAMESARQNAVVQAGEYRTVRETGNSNSYSAHKGDNGRRPAVM